MNLQILEAASDDLLEGFDFYEHGGQGIGYYFLSCLYTDIESLRIFGGIHRQVYKNLHRALSKRFPFATDLRPSPPMPLVFEKDGFKFMFQSNDHRPIHVHVRKGDGEAIFDVEDSVQLRKSAGMKIRELARAQELAEENKNLIIEKWYEHLA